MASPPLPFHFSIHGRVRGRVTGPARLLAPVIHELQYHEDKNPDPGPPDLVIALNPEDWRRDDEKPSPSFSHLLAQWQIQVSALAAPPLHLRVRANFLTRFIVSKWIVEPALRLAAEQKGAVMPHAAALSDGERAVLVAGPGGAGKTTWVLHWLGAGHPYLSDDFSFIEGDTVLPYVTPLRLSARNLLVNPALKPMAFRDKAAIVMRTALRRSVLGLARFSFKAPIARAVPGVRISPPAKLAGAVWITRPKGRARVIAAAEMAELMAGVDWEELHGFGAASPKQNWPAHRERLLAALADKPCLAVPAHDLPPASALTSASDLLAWLTPG